MKTKSTNNIPQKRYGVIYARYSNGPNQTEQSIEGQIHDCLSYAKSHNITIIETYADRHISGKSMDHRDELKRLLNDAKNGIFSVVVTWKVDRLGRNRQDLAFNKNALKRAGVKVEYAEESIPEGPEGIILESVLEGLAEYYSADLSQKIKRGQRESVAKGRMISGYKYVGYDKNDDLSIRINKDEANVVRKIFNDYADGKDQNEIIAWLNRIGSEYNGHKWSHNNIRRVLTCDAYIGKYRFGEHENDDIFPPIIEKELWDIVQERINETSQPKVKCKHAGRSYSSANFYLSGKVSCGICGNPYCGESGTGRHGEKHYYYKCLGRKKRRCECSGKTWRKDDLEGLILNFTVQDVLSDEMIDHIADLFVKEATKTEEKDDHLSVLNGNLQSTESKIRNLMKAIEAGVITDTTASRLKELEKTRDEIRDSIAATQVKKPVLNHELVVYSLKRFREGNPESEEFKMKILQNFVLQIIIYEEEIYVLYNIAGKDRMISSDDICEWVRKHTQKLDLSGMFSNPAVFMEQFLLFRITIKAA